MLTGHARRRACVRVRRGASRYADKDKNKAGARINPRSGSAWRPSRGPRVRATSCSSPRSSRGPRPSSSPTGWTLRLTWWRQRRELFSTKEDGLGYFWKPISHHHQTRRLTRCQGPCQAASHAPATPLSCWDYRLIRQHPNHSPSSTRLTVAAQQQNWPWAGAIRLTHKGVACLMFLYEVLSHLPRVPDIGPMSLGSRQFRIRIPFTDGLYIKRGIHNQRRKIPDGRRNRPSTS